MLIDFSYCKKQIEYIKGYIFKGALYRCNYIRFNTLYRNPALGCEKVQIYNFEPKGDVKASVIILHGLGSKNIKFLLWMGTHLASAGINASIIILPGNYTRVEDNSVSGRSYLWPDMKIMYQFWENAVIDVLSTIDLLEQLKMWKKNNCLVGYCLGGMVAGIVTAIDKRINQTIFMTTGGNIPNIIHESKATKFIRRLFKEGYDVDFYLNDKKKLYSIYNDEFKRVKQMSLIELTRGEDIHPLFRIDPISYAHLIDRSKVTFIDALFDETLPIKSRIALFKEMSGATRYVIPITHVGWLPLEWFLAEYILVKVNLYDIKTSKLILKKQKIENALMDFISFK